MMKAKNKNKGRFLIKIVFSLKHQERLVVPILFNSSAYFKKKLQSNLLIIKFSVPNILVEVFTKCKTIVNKNSNYRFQDKKVRYEKFSSGLFSYWNKSFGIMSVKNREIKHMNMMILYKLLKVHHYLSEKT